MHFISQLRYNPAAGCEMKYYRIKESFRDLTGRARNRIMLNVGFMTGFTPEEVCQMGKWLSRKRKQCSGDTVAVPQKGERIVLGEGSCPGVGVLAEINRNMSRDKDNIALLEAKGWRVITIWECSLRPKHRQETLLNLLSQLAFKPISHSYSMPDEQYNIAAEPDSTYT